MSKKEFALSYLVFVAIIVTGYALGDFLYQVQPYIADGFFAAIRWLAS